MSEALFIGHTYIDVTVLADEWPKMCIRDRV